MKTNFVSAISRPKEEPKLTRATYSVFMTRYIQATIIDAINLPSFRVDLPDLREKTWLKLLISQQSPGQAENERLEFVGDSVLDGVLSDNLYSHIPNGNPHIYTVIKGVLHSNQTFGHVARKLQSLNSLQRKILQVTSQLETKKQVKRAADLFETIAAALYLETGYWSVFDWVSVLFRKLIPIAVAAHSEFSVKFPKPPRCRVPKPSVICDKLPGKVQKKKTPNVSQTQSDHLQSYNRMPSYALSQQTRKQYIQAAIAEFRASTANAYSPQEPKPLLVHTIKADPDRLSAAREKFEEKKGWIQAFCQATQTTWFTYRDGNMCSR